MIDIGSTLTKAHVTEMYTTIRELIARWIWEVYYAEALGGPYHYIACDEKLFTHDGNNQVWAFGVHEFETTEIRVVVVENRN